MDKRDLTVFVLLPISHQDSPQEIISLDPTLYSVYPDTGECPFVYSVDVTKRFVTQFEIGVEANQFAAASTVGALCMYAV